MCRNTSPRLGGKILTEGMQVADKFSEVMVAYADLGMPKSDKVGLYNTSPHVLFFLDLLQGL